MVQPILVQPHSRDSAESAGDGPSVKTIDEPVEVRAGEKFALQIIAGAALKGEIHVHSTPEQTFKYQGGTSAFVMSIDQPGLVDVEADHSGGVIVQLKVV